MAIKRHDEILGANLQMTFLALPQVHIRVKISEAYVTFIVATISQAQLHAAFYAIIKI